MKINAETPQRLAVVVEQNKAGIFDQRAGEGDSAGRLIDAAGCKGLRIGSAEVSTKHANFIQADSDGLAADVHRDCRRPVHRECRRRWLSARRRGAWRRHGRGHASRSETI